jgi:hypothetical protein
MRKPLFPTRLLEDLADSEVIARIDNSKPQNLETEALPDGSMPVNPSMKDRDLAPEDSSGKETQDNGTAIATLQSAQGALKVVLDLFHRSLEDGKNLPKEMLQALTEMTEGLECGCDAMGRILEELGGASAAQDEQGDPSSADLSPTSLPGVTVDASASGQKNGSGFEQNLATPSVGA